MTVVLPRGSSLATSRCLLRSSTRPRRAISPRFSPANPLRRHATTTSEPRPSSSGAKASPPAPPPRSRRLRNVAILATVGGGIGLYQSYFKDALQPAQSLNTSTFTPFVIATKTPTSSSNTIFTLRPVNPSPETDRICAETSASSIWSVEFKQPQLQIARDYTPLPASLVVTDDNKASTESASSPSASELKFLVRKDPGGEVSTWLHNLAPGSKISLRGPHVSLLIPADTREVLFIAGGTGIAPALQVADALFKNENRSTDADSSAQLPRLHILWANRHREDCVGGSSDIGSLTKSSLASFVSKISGVFSSSDATTSAPLLPTDPHTPQGVIVRHLNALKEAYPGRITVDYFVDEESTFISRTPVVEFVERSAARDKKESASATANATPVAVGAGGKKLILVSGPEGFIKYFSGPKIWQGGREMQGRLGGVLGQLGLDGWSVWKL